MARGGRREGAGRKAGVPSAKTVQRQALAERAIVDGKTPLEIMIENMRHFQQVALDAEATIANLTAEEIGSVEMTPAEQFKFLLAKVKNAASLRQMAHECARDAAPFLHPRLANVQHSGDPDNPLEVVTRIERVIVGSHEAAGQDAADQDSGSLPTAH